MKFLVDRCAGRRLAEALRSDGHDALGPLSPSEDPGDEELLRLAASQDRILVTIDTDFGELIFRRGSEHAGVVRLPDLPARQRIEVMRTVVALYSEALCAGAVVTVRGGRIRVSGGRV